MNRIKIQKYKIKTDKKINKRICLLSDIHHNLKSDRSFYDKLLKNIINLNPDYIILGGDILDTLEVLKSEKSRSIIEYFIFSLGYINKTIVTLGNHDNNENNKYSISWFRSLNNNKNIYYLKNTSIKFDNIEFYNYTTTKEWFDDIKKDAFHYEFRRHPIRIQRNSNYKILITHSPDSITKEHNYNNLKEVTDNINLIMCGHMHNGALPEFLEFLDFKKTGKGIISPSKKLFPSYCRGLHKILKTDIIISRGINKFVPPEFLSKFNFLYNREITIIDLE